MESPVKVGKTFEFEKIFSNDPIKYGNVYLHQMGEVCYEPGYVVEYHRQWCFEITYIVSGEGIHALNGQEFPIKAGDLFLTPKGSMHMVSASSKLRYLFIGFDIDESANGEDVTMLRRFYNNSPANILTGSSEIMALFHKCLDEYYSSASCFQTMIESYLIQLLTLVYRAFTYTKNIRYLVDDKVNYVGLSLYSILLYIDGNAKDIKNIGELSKTLGYSSCYLSHVFKSRMGMTLQQYLCQKKIEESIALIETKKQTITSVSQLLGFSSPQSFSKAFKRVKGVCPQQYFSKEMMEKRYEEYRNEMIAVGVDIDGRLNEEVEE